MDLINGGPRWVLVLVLVLVVKNREDTLGPVDGWPRCGKEWSGEALISHVGVDGGWWSMVRSKLRESKEM